MENNLFKSWYVQQMEPTKKTIPELGDWYNVGGTKEVILVKNTPK